MFMLADVVFPDFLSYLVGVIGPVDDLAVPPDSGHERAYSGDRRVRSHGNSFIYSSGGKRQADVRVLSEIEWAFVPTKRRGEEEVQCA